MLLLVVWLLVFGLIIFFSNALKAHFSYLGKNSLNGISKKKKRNVYRGYARIGFGVCVCVKWRINMLKMDLRIYLHKKRILQMEHDVTIYTAGDLLLLVPFVIIISD